VESPVRQRSVRNCRFENILSVELSKGHWMKGVYVVINSSRSPHKLEVCPLPCLHLQHGCEPPALHCSNRSACAACMVQAGTRGIRCILALQVCELAEPHAEEMVAEILDCMAKQR
jgi:hypothetical protein